MKTIIGKIVLCGLLTAFAAMPVMAEDIDNFNTVDYVDEMIKGLEKYGNDVPMDISANPNAEDMPMVIAPSPMADKADTEYSVVVDNETVDLGKNKTYVSKSGAVMVPVRAIAEKLGYTVGWDNDNQGVKIDNGVINSTFCIGENLYTTVSSTAIGMSAPASLESAPELMNSTTYIPAKFFELLYYTVKVENGAVMISTEDNGANVQIPSPFVEYKTVEEARAAIKFDAALPSNTPTGYELTYISVMSGEMLQLDYTSKDNTITFRTAKGSEDISGDYNEYKSTSKIKVGDIEITVKGDGKTINNAMWTDKGMVYSIYADNGISEKELTAIVESVK